MFTVVIAEKPSVGKELANFLSAGGPVARRDGYLETQDFRVTWCFGHLMTLAEPHHYDPAFKKWSLDHLPIIPDNIKAIPKEDEGARKQLKIIGALLKEADLVIHAGDPDREGQLLVDWVLGHHHCDNGMVKRLWLSAQDKVSIQRAFNALKPNSEYYRLSKAAESRSIADWMVGMNLSRAFTLNAQQHGHSGVISIGRVQTPTLALVVMRDKEIEGFVSRNFYVPRVLVAVVGGSFWATWVMPEAMKAQFTDGRVTDRQLVARMVDSLPDKGSITKLEKKHQFAEPPLPYRLSRLQKEASAKFGLTADEVLNICQALYEKHKLTSYPRTDCDYLPESQHSDAPDILGCIARIAPQYSQLVQMADTGLKSSAWNDAKVTAHHAIIPVRGDVPVSSLSPKESQVYDLIVKAYLAQFFPKHEFERTTAEASFGQEIFRAIGTIPLVEGWKVVYGEDQANPEKGKKKKSDDEDQEEENQDLPVMQQGESAQNMRTEIQLKKTQPPKRYTDGTLVGDMENVHRLLAAKGDAVDPKWLKLLKENAGLGTEATRAGIIKTLVDRGFIERKGKQIISTTVGRALIDTLPRQITSPIMTAMMEQDLSGIEQCVPISANSTSKQFLEGLRERIGSLVSLAKSTDFGLKIPPKEAADPEKPSTSRPRKAQKPEEGGRSPGTASAGAEAKSCPKCGGSMILRKRKSDQKPFWGCSKFPECKHIESFTE